MSELVTVQLYRYEPPKWVAPNPFDGSKPFDKKKFKAGVCDVTTMLASASGAAALGTAATGIGAPLAAGFAGIAALATGVAAGTC